MAVYGTTDSCGGIFILSEPVQNALSVIDQDNNVISQKNNNFDQNQLTTNSEDLRKLSQEVKDFVIQNQSYLKVRNELKAGSFCSRDESNSIYEQSEDQQKAAINKEVTKEHGIHLSSRDDPWGWIVVFGSLICMIVVDGICFTYGLHCEWIKLHFSLTKFSSVVIPGSLLSGIYLITSPLANPLANNFGYRLVAMAGCLCATISFLVSSYCQSYSIFVIFFGLFSGIGFGLMYLPAIAIVAHWFNQLRAVAIGLALCGSGIGTCILSFLFPIIFDWISWTGSLILLSAMCFQSMVAISVFRPYELHQRLKQIKRDQKEWRIRNADLILEQKRLKKEKKVEISMQKEQKRREKIAQRKQIVIKRGSIFTRIMEEKSRQRTVSTGSLDGMMITQMNQLVKASQVDMNGGLLPSINLPLHHNLSQSLISNSLLQARAVDRIVSATLKALRTTKRSRAASKRSSINSISEMLPTNDLLPDDIPIELVKEYIEQNAKPKEDLDVPQDKTSFKIGSVISANDDEDQVKSVAAISQSSFNSHSAKQPVSDVALEQLSSIELPDEVKKFIRSELLKELDRPINRKDLYYHGSLHHLININSSNCTNKSYSFANFNQMQMPSCRLSCPVMNSSKKLDLSENQETSTNHSSRAKDQSWLTNNFDLNLLRTCSFQLLVFSCVTMMLGFFVPFFFLPLMLNKETFLWTSFAMCALGSSNIIGRLVATLYIEKGWAFQYQKVNGVNLTILFLTVSSIAVILMPYLYFIHVFWVLLLAFIYGFSIAMIVSIRSMLVVELFGVENLTKTFTFLLLFQGMATIFGPWISGYLCDIMNMEAKTFSAFIFSGICFIVSTFTTMLLKYKNRYKSMDPVFKRNPVTSFSAMSGLNSMMDSEMYNHQTTQTTNLMSSMAKMSDTDAPIPREPTENPCP